MSKIYKILISLILLVIIMASSSTFAATLSEVKYSNSKVTISGTCETSNQVQVIIFDTNKQPMYFATVDVVNKSFNKTLDAGFDFEEGKTYTVKIADYDGKGVTSKSFEAKEAETVTQNVVTNNNEKDITPKTGSLIESIGMLLIGLFSILAIYIIKNKKFMK